MRRHGWTERLTHEAWGVTTLTVGFSLSGILLAFVTGSVSMAISYLLPLWLLVLSVTFPQRHSRVADLEVALAEAHYTICELQLALTARSAPVSNLPQETLAVATLCEYVEDALHHLHDISYLGQHPLTTLRSLAMPAHTGECARPLITHLDQGRALRALLVDGIKRLRPIGEAPTTNSVSGRIWHPYLILHNCYVQGELTRTIMARLYISEGTYNRTRRRALQSVAQILYELETQQHRC